MKLTLVGLPLGNIEDISLRAAKTLSESKFVICEDTRYFYKLWQKLLNIGQLKYAFDGKLFVLNDFNEAEKVGWLLEQLGTEGEAILVSDAGMPLISDPGFRLVNEILARGGKIEVVPGPTAAMTAVAISGFSADKVLFLGFLPKKQSKRKNSWDLIKQADGMTVVLYESPVRVAKTLSEIEAEFGVDLPVVVAREITKEYEEVIRGKMGEIRPGLKKIKGEVVILFRYEKN